MTTPRQLWNTTTAIRTVLPCLDDILDAMAKAHAQMMEYRERRDESFKKIVCPECGEAIRAIDRGHGEEWAVCSHLLERIKGIATVNESQQPASLFGVGLFRLEDLPQT